MRVFKTIPLSLSCALLTSALLTSALLAGCARDTNDSRAMASSSGIQGRMGVLATAVPGAAALAQLPAAAGRVVQVVERRYADGLAQNIILEGGRATRGENRIEVALRQKPEGATATDNLVPLPATSDVAIASEIEARFAGMRMETVNILLQNRYGPYGMAAGRSANGERCIYAWQWIDDIADPGKSGTPGLASALISPPQPASLRVRLCRSGASADQIAALINDLVIGDRRGQAHLPVLGIAGGGGDALTAASGGQANARSFAGYQLPAAETFAASEPRHLGRHRASRKPLRHASHRRARAQRQLAQQQPDAYAPQPQAYVQVPQAYPSQPNALQPPPEAQRPRAYAPPDARISPAGQAYGLRFSPPVAAPPMAAVASAIPHPLDPSLPARAYRGPQGSAAQVLRPASGLFAPGTTMPLTALGQAAPVQPPQGGRLQREPVNPGAGI